MFLDLAKSVGSLVFLSFVPMEKKPDSFKYFLTISACDFKRLILTTKVSKVFFESGYHCLQSSNKIETNSFFVVWKKIEIK